jgi:hypothetical protein
MAKFYTFKATGSGEFPVDMLRYDGCYPRTTEDACNLKLGEFDRKERRTVELVMVVDSKDRVPTERRWASFGWAVSDMRFTKF